MRRASASAVAACLALATGCTSAAEAGGPGGSAGGPGAGPTAGNPVVGASVDSLRALGPAYTPYDAGPRLVQGDWMPALLESRLLPVIEKENLPADTQALVWVLVAADGSVADAVMHTDSRNPAFDEAALATARELRYRPATRGGTAVPVWVLAPVSLLMR